MGKELVLRASRWTWIGVFGLSALFTAAGVLMVGDEKATGWFVLSFFGLCAAVALLQVVRPSCLRLDEEAFAFGRGRKQRVRWLDVGEFRVQRVGGNLMVVFDFAPSYRGFETGRRVASALAGAEGALPDTYGLKAADLAALMNEWRSRAAGAVR